MERVLKSHMEELLLGRGWGRVIERVDDKSNCCTDEHNLLGYVVRDRSLHVARRSESCFRAQHHRRQKRTMKQIRLA